MTTERFKQTTAYKDITDKTMKFKSSYKHTLEYVVDVYSLYFTGNHYRNEFLAEQKIDDFMWSIDFVEEGKTPQDIIIYLK